MATLQCLDIDHCSGTMSFYSTIANVACRQMDTHTLTEQCTDLSEDLRRQKKKKEKGKIAVIGQEGRRDYMAR